MYFSAYLSNHSAPSLYKKRMPYENTLALYHVEQKTLKNILTILH